MGFKWKTAVTETSKEEQFYMERLVFVMMACTLLPVRQSQALLWRACNSLRLALSSRVTTLTNLSRRLPEKWTVNPSLPEMLPCPTAKEAVPKLGSREAFTLFSTHLLCFDPAVACVCCPRQPRCLLRTRLCMSSHPPCFRRHEA